jgi:hypothetical protein
MRPYKSIFLALCILPITLFAQNNLSKKADSLYAAKDYLNAGKAYVISGQAEEFRAMKTGNFYNAACCYSLANQPDSGMLYLKKAISSGYNNKAHLLEDTDLNSLHDRKDWADLLRNLQTASASTDDPTKARLITSDIKNFWKAYDLAQKDTTNRLEIYQKYYVDAGSPGLQDYFAYKVRRMKSFIKGHDNKPKFYAAIRKNTFTVEQQKPQMMASFVKFKDLYPAARFPNVYFIIGAFSSGGTSTDNGLLIGLDQTVRTKDIPVQELTLWQNNNLNDLAALPNLVAHELIHFNQQGMAGDTTLLQAVLIEGMADFIAEIISGKTPNERLHVWVKGKEKQVWKDFEKEMYLKKASNWIANSDQETADKPADLGYWVGYEICKAYYDKSTDKKKAIYDMLNIKDYPGFYKSSEAEKLFP